MRSCDLQVSCSKPSSADEDSVSKYGTRISHARCRNLVQSKKFRPWYLST